MTGFLDRPCLIRTLIAAWFIWCGGRQSCAQPLASGEQFKQKAGLGGGQIGVQVVDESVWPTLLTAIDARDQPTFLKLLKLGADPNVVDESGMSLVHMAAEIGDPFWIRQVLAHGGNPNSLQGGWLGEVAPLFFAIRAPWNPDDKLGDAGWPANVRALLEAGANINQTGDFQKTPIFKAFIHGNFEIVLILLNKGADPLAKGVSGSILDRIADHWETSITNEAQIPHFRAARQLLIDKGLIEDQLPLPTGLSKTENLWKNERSANQQPETLFEAIAARDKDAYLRLLKSGVSPNTNDENEPEGFSAVHFAAERDDVFWLQQALAHGGNPNQTTPDSTVGMSARQRRRHKSPYAGLPPIILAIRHWRLENVKLLLAAGAAVDGLQYEGTNPCGIAAELGNFELVVTLLEAGADPKLAHKRGMPLVKWFEERDERYVGRESQIPWYRKAREILIKQGLLRKDAFMAAPLPTTPDPLTKPSQATPPVIKVPPLVGPMPIFVTPLYDSRGPNGPQISVGTYSKALKDATAESIRDLTGKMAGKEEWGALPVETMFVTAIRLFDLGFKDEATFWFYSAQYRYRLFVRILPDDEIEIGSPMWERLAAWKAFHSLSGEYINRHALGDLPRYRQMLKNVIAANNRLPQFHKLFPDQKLHPDATWSEHNQAVSADFQRLIDYSINHASEIKITRKKNGLD